MLQISGMYVINASLRFLDFFISRNVIFLKVISRDYAEKYLVTEVFLCSEKFLGILLATTVAVLEYSEYLYIYILRL